MYTLCMIFVQNDADFLDVVAQAVLDAVRQLDDPWDALRMRVYLPNNRSCRELRDRIVKKCDKHVIVLPKFVVPVETLTTSSTICGIRQIMEQIHDDNMPAASKFDFAAGLFRDAKNVVQEQLTFDEILHLISNEKIVNIFKVAVDVASEVVSMSSIVEHTDYVRMTTTPCIIAGVSYSHRYLLDFLKAAHNNPLNVLVFQRSPDTFGFFKKLMQYIGAEYHPSNTINKPRNNISIIEPPNSLNEIKTISTIIRQHVGRRIALIYTDKSLASGIKTYLQRWNIMLDDSAGIKMRNTQEAMIALLTLQMLESDFATDETLELIKYIEREHAFELEKFVRSSQKIVPKLSHTELQQFDHLKSVAYILQMSSIFCGRHLSTVELSALFEQISRNMIDLADCDRFSELDEFFEQLHSFAPLARSFEEYYYLAVRLLDMYSVRSPYGFTPNIIAIAPIEAQALNADIVILCGFNDSNWLVKTSSYVFHGDKPVSLDVDNRRNNDIFNTLNHIIGSSEHVFITNAKSTNGLSSLVNALLSQDEIQAAKTRGADWNFSDSICTKNFERPSPSPPLKYRCKSYSVSDIESLQNNPYAFYAKKILKLNPLVNISSNEYKNRLRGIILHEALKISNNADKRVMRDNIIRNAHAMMSKYSIDRYHFSDWIFRLPSIAKFASEHIPYADFLEHAGYIDITISDDWIARIKCIADLLTTTLNGLNIVDYKTGTLPSKHDILNLNKPQLLVEALIASKGGFFGVSNDVSKTSLIRLGGADKSMELLDIDVDKKMLKEVENDIISLIRKYTIDLSPFTAVSGGYYDEYGHLARGKEWGTYL